MDQIKWWKAISFRIVGYCKISEDLGRGVYNFKVSSKCWGRWGHNKEPKKRDNSSEQEVGVYPIGQRKILSECNLEDKGLQLTRMCEN